MVECGFGNAARGARQGCSFNIFQFNIRHSTFGFRDLARLKAIKATFGARHARGASLDWLVRQMSPPIARQLRMRPGCTDVSSAAPAAGRTSATFLAIGRLGAAG